ncbi:hypothetical protein GCM10023196_037480 [Actinoallomurus vinaceus]|uniref:Uncharacterized protein n=1 Tax=Actinoallomurus vinaceus TaxID=1080074 RepID=A0ABP8UBB9_9ACTN
MASGEIHLFLSVNFPSNRKVRRLIRFGADSRACRDLYTQMLLYCKKDLTDGFVPDEELGILVYPDTPENGERDAGRLVEVGLIRRVDGGYLVPGFIKRNKTKAEVRASVADKATGGARGNHRRWHVDRGIVKAGCPYCERSRPPSRSDGGYSADREGPPPADQETPPLPPGPTDDDEPWPTDDDHAGRGAPAAEVLDIAALITAVRELRPDWTAASIRRALKDARVLERPASWIPAAMLAVARDPETVAPGRLANNGPWWRTKLKLAVVPDKCPDCNPFRHVEDRDGNDLGRCPRCHPSVVERAS